MIIPLLTQHYVLLQRNFIYTALIRTKRLVVIVGTRKALAIGVKNKKTQLCYTSLRHRLGQGLITHIPITPLDLIKNRKELSSVSLLQESKPAGLPIKYFLRKPFLSAIPSTLRVCSRWCIHKNCSTKNWHFRQPQLRNFDLFCRSMVLAQFASRGD